MSCFYWSAASALVVGTQPKVRCYDVAITEDSLVRLDKVCFC